MTPASDLSLFHTIPCFCVCEEVKLCIGCVEFYIVVRTYWRWMDKLMNGCWMDEWTESWMKWGIGWTDGWTYGGTDAWTTKSAKRNSQVLPWHEENVCVCVFFSVFVCLCQWGWLVGCPISHYRRNGLHSQQLCRPSGLNPGWGVSIGWFFCVCVCQSEITARVKGGGKVM